MCLLKRTNAVASAAVVMSSESDRTRRSHRRVVFWQGTPGAYLLINKGAHRISVFIFQSMPHLRSTPQMTIEQWHANGLDYVSIGDVSRKDLESLRRSF